MIENFMMQPNISTFIYILDVTYVSSTNKQIIHPTFATSSNIFEELDSIGLFIYFYLQFFLRAEMHYFFGCLCIPWSEKSTPVP